MQEPLFSVIIPVYNTEAYLADCLQSAQSQTLRNIELLCIDDGSTDRSAEILRQFAAADERIRLFGQENRGISCARNLGIRQARGKYLCFLDSDDLLRPEALQHMADAVLPQGLDLLVYEFVLLQEPGGIRIGDGTPLAWRRQHTYPGMYTGEALYCEMFQAGDYRCMVWSQCFRRAFLLDAGLTFAEGMVYEDELFTLCALLRAQRVRYLDEILYTYRLRSRSIMSSSPSLHKLTSSLRLLLDLTQLCLSPDLMPQTRTCIAEAARGLLGRIERIYSGALPGSRPAP